MSRRLPSGHYTITSKIDNRPISSEDNPWGGRVYILPEGGRPLAWFLLTHDSGGHHTISAGDAVTVINGSALSTDTDDVPQQWVIIPTFSPRGNEYNIVEADIRQKGWVVNNTAPYGQLAVQPLETDPPFFPPSEVFVINPV